VKPFPCLALFSFFEWFFLKILSLFSTPIHWPTLGSSCRC
jgi:hypothetical protein